MDPAAVHHRGDQPAQQGGGGVVRMPLQLRGQVPQVAGGEGAPQQGVGPEQAGHQAGGGAPQPAGHGDVVLLPDVQPPEGAAAPFKQPPGRLVDQVAFVGRDRGAVGRFNPAGLVFRRAVGLGHPYPVV